jgi:hypothetical protein
MVYVDQLDGVVIHAMVVVHQIIQIDKYVMLIIKQISHRGVR